MVEMDLPSQMGYDRAIVVFSPEGRIYQVEYALQAVKLAKTQIGVVYKKGVILAAHSPLEKLQIQSKASKVAKIDEHIGVAVCGFTGDARVLTDNLRVQAQIHRLTYGEPIDLFVLAKKLADRMQLYTQFAGARPYGASVLLGGINEEPALYVINPSGTLYRWKAKALGRGEKEAQKYLEKKYKDNMTFEEARKLAIDSIVQAEQKIEPVYKENIEILNVGRKK
ncbi:MAG: proteasome subunit alpha [Candidatus Aenigmarchaeota archaeon ex4484_56]|nr:MAG: proteasome subunit alpha [Candidatus Aenigmarchaeota archaeon ex4484_56]